MKYLEFNHRRNDESFFSGRATLYKTPRYNTLLEVEYSAPSHHTHIYLDQDDEDMTFSIASPICAVWISVPPFIKNCYKDIFHLSIHDKALWWSFWTNSHYHSSKTPKWKDGCFHFDDFFLGKTDYSSELLDKKDVLIPMPEKSYKAVAKLYEAVWKRPRWFAEKIKRVEIEMLDWEEIPIPGKGENSYDCDDDAIFSMTVPAETIEEGIGKLVADVLRTRMKRIGKHMFGDKARK